MSKRLMVLVVVLCAGCAPQVATVRDVQDCERLLEISKTPQDTLIVRAVYPSGYLDTQPCAYYLDARKPR